AKQSAWVTQLVQQYRGTTLAIKLPPSPSPSCPQCGVPMRQRTGKSGAFWSCSRYPDCKGTLPVDTLTGKRGAPRKQRASPKAS
ncbi:topoisomerase DNA-binding C4 zinc finger domain-containing protein, partial [Aromatoleum toluclasticum]|uniref:topoisomerase DNA-binding C4 zinc finger domain-containing protein n=1 Tax=Aromatoleum toluclasticum TaxID=92003 RepID=UPI001D187363